MSENGLDASHPDHDAGLTDLLARAIVREIPEGTEPQPPPEGYVKAAEVELDAISEETLRKSMEAKKQEREKRCHERVAKLLEEEGCDIAPIAQINNQTMLAASVLRVPVGWGIVSK